MNNKKTLKKLGMAIIATITSASVLLSNSFDSPKELLEDINKKDIPTAQHYEYSLNDTNDLKPNSHNRFKQLIYKIPVKIRMILCIPLWFIGNMLLMLFHALFNTLLTPIAYIIITFIIQTIILLSVIAVSIKLLFPDLPWSKILSFKTITFVILGSLLMSAFDFAMIRLWDQYSFYRSISKLILGLIVVTMIMKPFIKKKKQNMYTYEIQY